MNQPLKFAVIIMCFLLGFINNSHTPCLDTLEAYRHCKKFKNSYKFTSLDEIGCVLNFDLSYFKEDKEMLFKNLRCYLENSFNYSLFTYTAMLFKKGKIDSFLKVYSFSFYISTFEVLTKFNIQLGMLYSKYAVKKGNSNNVILQLINLFFKKERYRKDFSKFILSFGEEYFFKSIQENLFNFYPLLNQENSIIGTKVSSKNLDCYNKFKNHKYYTAYMSRYVAFFSKQKIRNYLLDFYDSCRKKLLNSQEYKSILKFLPEISLSETFYKQFCIYSHEKKIIHDLLNCILLKTRFINFLLFGKFDRMIVKMYLPKYKIKILMALKLNILSMYLSFLNNFYFGEVRAMIIKTQESISFLLNSMR